MDWSRPEPGVDPLDNCEAIFPRATGWGILLVIAAMIVAIAAVVVVISADPALREAFAIGAIGIAALVLVATVIISIRIGGKTGISPEGIITVDWRRRHALVPYTAIMEMSERSRPLRSAHEYSLTIHFIDGEGIAKLRVAHLVRIAFGGASERIAELRDAVTERARLHTTDEDKRGLDLLLASSFGFGFHERHWTRTTGDADVTSDTTD